MLLLVLALQSCPQYSDRWEAERITLPDGTYSSGVNVADGYIVECSYFDTRGKCILDDCGSVTFQNVSGRRKWLNYDHYFHLGCDIKDMEYEVIQSDHPTLRVSTCYDETKWVLSVSGVVWGTQTTSVSWEVHGWLTADLNRDGAVDGADIGLLLSAGSEHADINDDGEVDGEDIGALLSQWT